MRTVLYFLFILAICITATYTYKSWLPPTVDFILQKSTPLIATSTDPDYQLYEKYNSAPGTYSDPAGQCYSECAKSDFSAFQLCTASNRCDAI